MKLQHLIIALVVLTATVFTMCKPHEMDDIEVGDIPTAAFTHSADASAPYIVTFAVTSEEGFLFVWEFGDGGTMTTTDKNIEKSYLFSGDYAVSVIVYGKGGTNNIEQTITITESDPNVCIKEKLVLLTGGCDALNGKSWKMDPGTTEGIEAGLLPYGVGPRENFTGPGAYSGAWPSWWWQKAPDMFDDATDAEHYLPCFYLSRFNFKMDGSKYSHINNGSSACSWYYAGKEYGIERTKFHDICVDYTPKTNSRWSLSETEDGKLMLNLTENEFLGYYEGNSEYEILSLSADSMHVRAKYDWADEGDSGLRYFRFLAE